MRCCRSSRSCSYDNRDVSVDGPEKRGLLHCVLRIPQRAIDVHAICVHLGLKESHRNEQLEHLCRVVHDRGAARTRRSSSPATSTTGGVRAHRVLDGCAGLREVFVQADGRAGEDLPRALADAARSTASTCATPRCTRPVVLPRRPWSHLSDHAPLAAEIAL